MSRVFACNGPMAMKAILSAVSLSLTTHNQSKFGVLGPTIFSPGGMILRHFKPTTRMQPERLVSF